MSRPSGLACFFRALSKLLCYTRRRHFAPNPVRLFFAANRLRAKRRSLFLHTRYDAAGRTIETRTQTVDDASANPQWLVTQTVYNDAGQVVCSTDRFLVRIVSGTEEMVTETVTGTYTRYENGLAVRTEGREGFEIELPSDSNGLLTSRVAVSGTVVWQTESIYDKGRLMASIGRHAPGKEGSRTDYAYLCPCQLAIADFSADSSCPGTEKRVGGAGGGDSSPCSPAGGGRNRARQQAGGAHPWQDARAAGLEARAWRFRTVNVITLAG